MKIFNDIWTCRRRSSSPSSQVKVKMYACGPTVYNYIHVGNARPIVILPRRAAPVHLEYRGYEVRRLRALPMWMTRSSSARMGRVSPPIRSPKVYRGYWKDVTALGVRPATIASQRRPGQPGPIIKIIKTLVEKRAMPTRVNGDVPHAQSLPDTANRSRDLQSGTHRRERCKGKSA